MAIPKEIQEKIRDLAREQKWNELVNFLEQQLAEKKVTVQDIFHCVKTLTWKHPQDYAIASSAINSIGVMVGKLQDTEQKKLCPQFYALAAKRGNDFGYRNLAACFLYGKYGIKKSPENALEHAKQAVIRNKGQTHSLILHECLKENQQDLEANTILINFLGYLATNQKNIEKEVKDKALKLFDAMIEDFFNQFDFTDDIEPPTEELCRHYLTRIKTILSINALPEEFEVIRQKASFLKGQLHEYLGEYPAAMQSYCVVTEKNTELFEKAIAARANLLKKQAHTLLAFDPEESESAGSEAEKSDEEPGEQEPEKSAGKSEESDQESENSKEKSEESDQESENSKEKSEESDQESENSKEKSEESDQESENSKEKSEESDQESENSKEKSEESEGEGSHKEIHAKSLLLPDGLRLPTDFGRFWVKEALWFYSVNEEGLREEGEIRKAQLKQLFDSKKLKLELELEAVSSTLTLKKHNEQLILKKEALTRDLKSLEEEETLLLKELSTRIDLYLPENRGNIRAHGAEQRFFDFNRSKKKKKLSILSDKIIDHRVRELASTPEPIDLSDTSARLFITTEKLWQETLNPYNNPKGKYAILPLPTARKTSWQFDYSSGTNDYAPPEFYKIGNTEVTSEHRTNPKKQRLGDSFLPDLTHYKAIRKTLIDIVGGRTGIEEAKKIARLMIRYGQHQQSITSEELQDLYSDTETLSPKDIIKYTDLFNQICFLVMVKEQAQWLSATDPQYQLGMAVAQARCLIMMEAGFITLQEAFDSGALFGVYTGSKLAENAEALARPCRAINELYLVYLQSKHSFEYINFFKKNLQAKDKKSSIQNTLVLTREQAHLDLKYVYGGESDTDDEEYTSDLDKDHDLQKSMGKCSL